MKTYQVIYFDPKTRKTSTLATIPDKTDQAHFGKYAAMNELKTMLGEEWVEKNRNYIGLRLA